jgi:hypothetical protein
MPAEVEEMRGKGLEFLVSGPAHCLHVNLLRLLGSYWYHKKRPFANSAFGLGLIKDIKFLHQIIRMNPKLRRGNEMQSHPIQHLAHLARMKFRE